MSAYRYDYCRTCSAVIRDFHRDAVWRNNRGDIYCGDGFHEPLATSAPPELDATTAECLPAEKETR